MARYIEEIPIWQIVGRDDLPLLPGTLSPTRLNLVDNFYDHVRYLCREFVSGKEETAAIALGVPEVGPGGVLGIRFPVYEALGAFAEDDRARSFLKLAEANQLYLPASECLVGLSLGFLAGDSRVQYNSFTGRLQEDAGRHDRIDSAWLEIEEPEVRYKGCFQRSWDKETPAKWHYIRPIMLDQAGIFAGFAVDFIGRPQTSPFALIRENIERLLLGIYKAYYCHFGAGSQKFPWNARSSILERRYLEGLTEALDRQGLDSCFPKAASCLVFFCDGDGIKRINDQYNHSWGNEVIQMLASVLHHAAEDLCLGNDRVEGVIDAIVMRWGGDEFVVIMPAADGVDVTSVVSGFKLKLEEKLTEGCDTISDRSGKNIRVDLSVGWTEWRGRGSFRDAWFEHAENAMYVAKDGARLIEALKKKNRPRDGEHGTLGGNSPRRSRVSMGEYHSLIRAAHQLAANLGMAPPPQESE